VSGAMVTKKLKSVLRRVGISYYENMNIMMNIQGKSQLVMSPL
jgi:hypothetical protein